MKTLDEVIEQLPPDLQREVQDFAQFLLERKARPKQRKLRQSWAGGLREFRDRFTSLDLQKKALEWWGDETVSGAESHRSRRPPEGRTTNAEAPRS